VEGTQTVREEVAGLFQLLKIQSVPFERRATLRKPGRKCPSAESFVGSGKKKEKKISFFLSAAVRNTFRR